jgi:nicotinate dehydrogenase subunit B
MSDFNKDKFSGARRVLLKRGALVFGFSLLPAAAWAEFNAMGLPKLANPRLPGSLKNTPLLDAWIRVAPDGKVTVCSGKVELGTGVRTALMQIALEQLELAPGDIRFVGGDTGLTPNEGFTAGSHTIADSGTALLHASAQVAALLRQGAAARWRVDPATVTLRAGRALGADGRGMHYGEALKGLTAPGLHRAAAETSVLRDPAHYRLIGKPVPRVDIPAKVTGGAAYVQDMRLPGMLHARVVRPPRPGATLTAADLAAVRAMPGVHQVVRDGSYLAVLADDECAIRRRPARAGRAARYCRVRTPSTPPCSRCPRRTSWCWSVANQGRRAAAASARAIPSNTSCTVRSGRPARWHCWRRGC